MSGVSEKVLPGVRCTTNGCNRKVVNPDYPAGLCSKHHPERGGDNRHADSSPQIEVVEGGVNQRSVCDTADVLVNNERSKTYSTKGDSPGVDPNSDCELTESANADEDHGYPPTLVERQAKAAVRELIDRILYTSKQNKNALLGELRLIDSRYHTMQNIRENIEYATDGWVQESDFCILLDGISLAQSAGVNRMVTGDTGYLHAEEVTAHRYGLALVWAENEFYTDNLTYSRKESEAAFQDSRSQID